MKKQILTLIVSAAVFSTSPAFGMDTPEPQTTSLHTVRLQKKLKKLDEHLRTVQNKIQEEVECFNVGWP